MFSFSVAIWTMSFKRIPADSNNQKTIQFTGFVTHQSPDEAGNVEEEGLDEQEERHPLVVGDLAELSFRNVLGDVFVYRYEVGVFRPKRKTVFLIGMNYSLPAKHFGVGLPRGGELGGHPTFQWTATKLTIKII